MGQVAQLVDVDPVQLVGIQALYRGDYKQVAVFILLVKRQQAFNLGFEVCGWLNLDDSANPRGLLLDLLGSGTNYQKNYNEVFHCK